MSGARWRLIIDGAADGAWNMAVDAALLASREGGDSPATLRLYRWSVPTVSLGRFQQIGQVDLEVCASSGTDVVRRPTGGRGVLHDDELTYCVVASVSDGVPRGTTASYRHLCAALVEAYRALGVDAALTPRSRGESASGACYLHSTQADLSLGEAKLSGSAQTWRGGSVLQHGSFVVSRDHDLEAGVFRLQGAGVARMRTATAAIEEVTGSRPSQEDLVEAVVTGFSRALGVVLVPGGLTEAEREEAAAEAPAYRVACR